MKERRLGGVMIYTLDLDDFSGHFCDHGPHPLIRSIRNFLNVPDPPEVKDWIPDWKPNSNLAMRRAPCVANVDMVFSLVICVAVICRTGMFL